MQALKNDRTCRLRGTTLIELMMVVVIVGILAAIALPSFGEMRDRAAVASATTAVMATLATARHAAIANGRTVTASFNDARGEAVVAIGADTLSFQPITALHGVTMSVSRDSIAYGATGRGYGAANTRILLRRGRMVDTVNVSRLGRARR